MTPKILVNRTALVIVTLSVIITTSYAQTRKAKPDSGMTIITKVPFEGKNYFITIVPIDTIRFDNMPSVDPHARNKRLIIWPDSIQKLFPDAILRRLNKEEERLPQRKQER